MSNIPTTPPSGFRDFTPEACALRGRAIETISRVYRSFGFSQIATSAVEDLAVLMGKGGGENEKLIFKILKRGEKLEAAQSGAPGESGSAESELADLGLRFDLTLPLARYYVRHQGQLPHPFKAFHIGPVWRAERAQKGRYREFYQCDADIIGSNSIQCEIDVIHAILTVFKALGLSPEVMINDRELLLNRLRGGGVPEDKIGKACVILDKLDKIGEDGVRSELREHGIPETILAQPRLDDANERLHDIKQSVDALVQREAVILAPNLVRGFDYYTTTVFEFRLAGAAGSIGGGGRYDRLTEKFGGQPIPACGASIGFERLMLLLEEAEARPTGPDFCVTLFSEELRPRTLAVASALRQEGFTVDVYPGSGKLKAQFKYADAKRARFALILGPEEAQAGKVKIKDLGSGEERQETVESLIAGRRG